MTKLVWIVARFLATALLGIIVLIALGWGGAQAQVQAQMLTPPMAATLVAVCSGRPCLATLPQKLPDPAALRQNKSRKRLTRRST